MNKENEQLLIWMDDLVKVAEENGTNFEKCFPQHFEIVLEYLDAAKKLGLGAFPDKEMYQKFCCAKLFFDKLNYIDFQNYDDTESSCQSMPSASEDDLPPLEAFHYTKDEIEMKKSRILESIRVGDVLHLKVMEETVEEYHLQILNKYGDKERIIDCSIFAVLFKTNPLVQSINPPLQIGDMIRATAFGNVKQEMGQYKKMIVSLNPNVVAKQELKSLHLGRVYRKDIPYYPVDISKYKSFGEYLKANNKFKSPENFMKLVHSFGCDPSKTGPLYETKYKKQMPENVEGLITETQKMAITHDKMGKALELLKKNELLNAFLQIQEVLEESPDDDMALTVRGKIYMALAGGQPSRNNERALRDFEAALALNRFNEEAKELQIALILLSKQRFIQQGNQKVDTCEHHLRKVPFRLSTIEFLKQIEEGKNTGKKTSASSSHSVPEVKEEPKDI